MLRRRNLLKRVLPILLSLAMTLQSVPITAMAAELPVAATAEEAEAATESLEETEATVEPTEETGTTEDAEAAESAAQPEEDATVEDTAAEDEVKSDETTENTGDQPDAVTEEDGVKSDDAAEDSESKPETVKKPVAETETEVAANGADAQKPGVARIVVDDRAVDEWLPGDFVRKLGETDETTGKPILVFFTEYVESGKGSQFQDVLQARMRDWYDDDGYHKGWLDVEIDGEKVDALKDSLTYTWKNEKGEQLVDAVPVNAGTYELTISLDTAGTNGLYETVEPAKLTLIIEPARVELWIDAWTQPGKTVGDLIDNNNENYQIVYADRKDDNGDPLYTVSRDIIDIADKKLPMHIFEIDESGARKELTETPTEKFDSTKDYILTIDPIALTANAKVNYELSLEDFWKIVVGDRQGTMIKFERKDPGKDLIKVYDEKAVTIEEVTTDLFTETGAPAVYVWDNETEKDVPLEGAELAAGWYTRIQLNEGESYKLDEDAGEFRYYDSKWNDDKKVEEKWERDNYIYKPMKADPVDAGEYYIVWSYAGDAGAYLKSYSEAIRYTIDPAPVVINIDPDSYETTEKGAQLGFTDGMTAEDVNKTLAKIAYGAYPIVKNAETGALEIGKDKVNKEPEFFGTSYGIEDETDMTQYFVPEFMLQRRLVSMTEKDGNVIVIPVEEVDGKKIKRTVDWNNTATLNVVVEKNKDGEFEGVDLEKELPQDAETGNLKSLEFEFRVYFTGNKVVYEKDGTKRDFGGVPVTDVTTNAANKNYLADITNARLEASAVMLDVASAAPVTINTEEIVKAFVGDNQDSLYPQPAEGADDPHKGTMPEPAVKIYDQKGLFTNRTSYKQAKVFGLGEDGAPAGTPVAEDTSEKLTYTWSYTSLEEYENYLKTWDEVQRQYKDFDEYYFETYEDLGWTSVTSTDDGSLTDPKSVGVYRLTVKFDDTDREYRSAEAEVFFKVEAQEVIVVPKEQYVAKDSDINFFRNSLPNKLENRNDYIIYKLPQNSEEEFNKLSDDDKKAYEIPTEDALALYEKENGEEFRKNIVNGRDNWKVLRKEKNSEGKDTEVWIEATGAFEEGYTYGIAANWAGSLTKLDGEAPGENYTTKDVKTFRETGEEKHHESVGDVKFYDGKIYVEVDEEKIEALGHEYDGTADKVSLEEVAKAITLYTDEELTASSKLPATVINTTDEYDPAKINIYWQKAGNRYANKNAVYGGTYSLVLRFEGGSLTTPEATQDDAAEPIYAPFDDNGWWYSYNKGYEDAKFTITPREITIKPKLLDANLLKAGDNADKLVTGDLELDENIVENDKKFFTYVELAEVSFDVIWDGKNADGTDKEGSAYKYEVGKNGGYPAFSDRARYAIQADGRDLKDPERDYLRFGSTYTVKLKNTLVSPLKESYRVTYAPAVLEEITKRGNAEVVTLESVDNLKENRIVYNFSNSTYTVMPRASVKFYGVGEGITVKDRYGKDKKLENTNILGFRIKAPKEFWSDGEFADWDEENNTWSENLHADKFVYQNAIWNAGGYFYKNGIDKDGNGTLDDDEKTDWNGHYIDVVFPLTKENLDLSFNITWENDYTETFKLADVVLEEDLTKAVAPKSMAFNGVATKMAVGERQQLNLKITKAQLGDVIAVRYRIKGSEETHNDFISLDPETGVVTGLQAGKTATQIEAYAVYKDAKGNFVPVLDSKGKEKVASTKITVTEVTAPAIKKIVTQGETAKVYFTVPDNGYRREIYVVDVADNAAAKKWKAAQFNDAIAGIKNGDWKTAGFAIEPEYSYAKNNDLYDSLYEKELRGEYDSKLKAHILTLDRKLKAEHEYVIYVRNVSAVRELDDGSVVTLSAMGSVKKAKTTKSQVKKLDLDFTIKTGENDKKNTVTHPVNANGTVNTGAWTVELSAKKAQLNVYGIFSDLNDAAEKDDERKYPLVPTSKEKAVKDALKNYQLPKLEYVILDQKTGTPFDPAQKQSKYATINKKGLISLKGVDLNGEATVYIYARDNMQHQDLQDYDADDSIELTITAKATSVTGKKVKAVVGQEIRLADCLTYKDGKKTIPNYRSGNIQITPEMRNAAEVAGYRISEKYAEDKNGREIHDWYITALRPNKDKFVLKVTDFGIDANAKPEITLTSKQMDPVKGLKVTYVDDKNITINFTHAANKNEADNGQVYQYAFEIKDARGNVVEKRILSNPHKVDNTDKANAKELKSVQSWIQYDGTKVDTDDLNAIKVDDQNAGNRFNYYTGTNAKVKTFAYTYTNPDGKLVRLSSYTISVTPLYEKQKADKAATTKTKTTNIPASYKNPDLAGAAPDRRGGTDVEVTTIAENRQKDKNGTSAAKLVNINVDRAYPFVSGNTYTLRIAEDKQNKDVPRDRVTDTLTWKSSNTKVATIKANAGTYTATFKPVNQGETTITVTSKITKKVIARHAVKVVAVRDGAGYGGDYEPTWENGFYEKILALYDPYYDGPVEVLSMNVPLTINDGESRWISFTAPHFGNYFFNYSSGTQVAVDFFDSRDGRKIAFSGNHFVPEYDDDGNAVGGYWKDWLNLEEGQKVYFKTSGTVIVTGTEYARLTQANTKANPLEVKEGFAAFTAWEDNVYTFWLNGKKLDEYENIEGFVDRELSVGQTEYVPVPENGKMYVTWPELDEAQLTIPVPVTLNKDKKDHYVTFKAKIAGEYAFKYVVPADNSVNVTYEIKAEKSEEIPVDGFGDEKDGTKESVKNCYLEEDQKVVIKFTAEPEITDAAKTLSASVTVTAQDRRKDEWKDGTITIAKGTTEIVEYVIPAFTEEKAKFKFEVSGEAGTLITRYLDKKLEKSVDVNDQSFTLMAGKETEFKAGDSIYIEVMDGGDSENKDAKPAVLKVTQIKPIILEEGEAKKKSGDINNDTENWYTFTAPADGFYEFAVTVDPVEAGDNHTPWLELYKELFAESEPISEKILALKSGETLAIKLVPGYVPDKVNEDGTTTPVTSKANVSVEKLVIEPLNLGTEKPVTIEKASNKVKYYSFTAAVTTDYTIAWKPAEKDNSKVTLLYGDVTNSYGRQITSENPWEGGITTGNVRYIKVELGGATGEDAVGVEGKLCVTSDKLIATVLTKDEPKSFNLGGKNGLREQVFRFTAPKAGYYTVVTTLGENPETKLPYTNGPDIYEENYSDIYPPETLYFAKGQTRYFILTSVEKTEGEILVRSESQEFDETKPDVSVANGETKQYTFEITESGRYEFMAEYGAATKADVRVSDNKAENMTLANASGRYYRRNDVVTISVIGRNSEKAESVKLYKPVKITPTALVIDKSKSEEINLDAGKTGYYEISVTDPKTYELKVTDIVGTANAMVWCAENNDGLSYQGYCNSATSVNIPRNGKLFIKIKSNDDKAALKCKLNITESKELKVGDNPVSLEAGETAKLVFRAPETGYYSFEVSQPKAELLFNGKTGDSFYQIDPLNAKDTITYTLKNEGTAKVDLTVKMTAVKPIAVIPGGSKAEAKDIPADGEAYFALKTFKKADYLIKIADTSKGKDLLIQLNDDEEFAPEANDDGIVVLNENLSGETMLRIKNDGIAKTTITVELTVDEADAWPTAPITLKKGESKLISYVAEKENRYLISKDNKDVKMTLVKMQDAPKDGNVDLSKVAPNLKDIKDPADVVLGRADKLVYKLEYNPDDEKAAADQTVNVTIAAIVPTEIKDKSTSIPDEKGNISLWYQFTAEDDAVYTFSLEDENENVVDGKMSFYSYMTQEAGVAPSEKIMKAKEKLFIKLTDLDEDVKYTLKYKDVKTVKVNDVDALDFEYEGEVQELTFVVPKAGTYKVSAAVFRGEFDVSGTVGEKTVVTQFTAPGTGSRTTSLLKKDDVLKLKVKANKGGKSSVSIRIAEESVAKTMELDTEYTGDINKDEPIYYEIRIAETAKYAISAGGPLNSISYALDGTNFTSVSDVEYVDLKKDNRVIIKVASRTEGVYSVKIAQVSADSLDSNDTAEKALTATEGEKDYRFTKKNAFVKFTAPAAGEYYIAVDEIDNVSFDYVSFEPELSSGGWDNPAGMVTLTEKQKVTFTFKNTTVKDEPEEPAARAATEEAMFRLTIRAAKAAEQNPINAGEKPKQGTLAKNESVSYQFKAAKAASYVFGFKMSGCSLVSADDDKSVENGEIRAFTANETLNLKVKETAGGIGRYELTVEEFAPKKLTLGVTEQGTLKKGEKAYYEFVSDGEKTYQVYASGTDFNASYALVDNEGNENGSFDIANKNKEVKLQNGEKLAFELGCNDDATKNAGFKLTVKEVKYTPITAADTAHAGSLDASEKAYYEFTSQNEKATPYTVYLDKMGNDVSIYTVQKVVFVGEGADRKLGDPEKVNPSTSEVQLEKGEKLLITVANDSTKKSSYTLTVEDQTAPEITPIALTLGEKVTGKLYSAKEKAVYEFTADADETYSVYFTGDNSCNYNWTRTSEADGKTTTDPVGNGSCSIGSNEFACKKGDKITLTVRGSGKYELTVNKVTYEPLTQGITKSKTLNPGETVYYQFTSTDTPATGEETTKYQVYGSGNIKTRTLTVGDDGKTDADSQGWDSNWSGEKELPKDKKILQFKVTNSSENQYTSNLTVKKVEYKAMTSGTAVEGTYTWADDGYPYYEFTATDTPAEGQTQTQYYVYGTNYFKYRTSSKEGEKLTWSDEHDGSAGMGIWLEKDQRVRFKVTSSPYSLTVANYPEAKPITVGTEIRTGSLANGQKLIYTLKYEKDTPTTYLLNYEYTYGVNVTAEGGEIKEYYTRFVLSKDQTLKVTISAYNAVDDFAFTLSEFKPEELTLGTPVQKVLAAGETAYYQYTVAKDADYVVVQKQPKKYSMYLTYEVNGVSQNSLNYNINECNFKKDDVVLIKMYAYNSIKRPFQLLLQEKPAESTALKEEETAISLKGGEVKYFTFTIPDAEKEKGTEYMLTVQGESNVPYQIDGQDYSVDPEDKNEHQVSDDIASMRVANTSTSETNCTITIQKFERTKLTLGVGSEKTLQTDEKAYYEFTAPETGYYVLTATTGQYWDLNIYDDYDDYWRSWNGLTGFNFEGGVTYSFDLQASNDITYTLEIQQLGDPEVLPSEGTVTLQPGEVKRYIYHLSDDVEDDEYFVRIRKSQSADLAYTVQEEYNQHNGYAYYYETNSKISFYPYTEFEVLVSNLLSSGDVSYEIEVERSPYIKDWWDEDSGTEHLYFEESPQTKLYQYSLYSDEGNCTINIDDEDVSVEYAPGDPDYYGWSSLPEDGKISWKYGWEIYLKVTYTGSETGKECELNYSVTRTGNVWDE